MFNLEIKAQGYNRINFKVENLTKAYGLMVTLFETVEDIDYINVTEIKDEPQTEEGVDK